MALRTLTTQEREEARAKALAARTTRAEVKDDLRGGRVSLAQILERADSDPAVGRMRTIDLLQTLHGVGEVRAAAIMQACDIAPNRRLRGVGRRQRQALIAYIGR